MTTTDVVGEDLASQLDQDGVADLFATSACENESRLFLLPIPMLLMHSWRPPKQIIHWLTSGHLQTISLACMVGGMGLLFILLLTLMMLKDLELWFHSLTSIKCCCLLMTRWGTWVWPKHENLLTITLSGQVCTRTL